MKRTYAERDWERLGLVVSRARRTAGLADTKAWAEAVDRSQRMVLGLERGEPVGRGTLERVEIALGWESGTCYRILDDPDLTEPPTVGGATQDAPGYVRGPGPKVEGGASEDEVLRAIQQMQRDMQEMERRLSERMARLEEPGS